MLDTVVRPVDDVIWGGTRWVESLSTHLGGNGANTAFALAKLGVPVRLIGWVGRDPLGQQAEQILREAGVDLSGLRRDEDSTAATVALVRSDGQRAFLHRPGVSRVAFPEPIDFSTGLIEGITHYHLANPYGFVHLRRHAPEMLRRAKAVGLTTSLDTAWDSKGEWGRVLAPCLPWLDILFVNETEAARFDAEGLALTVPLVVMKLGAQGCAVNGELVPGYPVKAIDTTGAGDCFAGGFLAARHRGLDPVDAARFANAVGALSTLATGAGAGLRSYSETEEWIRCR